MIGPVLVDVRAAEISAESARDFAEALARRDHAVSYAEHGAKPSIRYADCKCGWRTTGSWSRVVERAVKHRAENGVVE